MFTTAWLITMPLTSTVRSPSPWMNLPTKLLKQPIDDILLLPSCSGVKRATKECLVPAIETVKGS